MQLERGRLILIGAVATAVVLAFTAMLSTFAGRTGYSSNYDPNDFAFVLVGLLPVIATTVLTRTRGI